MNQMTELGLTSAAIWKRSDRRFFLFFLFISETGIHTDAQTHTYLPLITMPWLGTSLNWHDSTMALLTSLVWAMSPSHTHMLSHTLCAFHTCRRYLPPLLGSPLSLRKTPSRNPANGRPPIHHKPERETERGGERTNTAAILADGGEQREGRGKDEGRMGRPRCKHRPTEHSPTCGVN